MKISQKTKLGVDIALFTIFVLAFYMDLTGLSLHQWIGVAGGAIVAVHLVLHWGW